MRANPVVVILATLAAASGGCARAGDYHTTTTVRLKQPIAFRHKLHCDYLSSGKHPQEKIALHAEVLDFEDEGPPEELLKGQCTQCHEPGLVDVPSCARCHLLFEDQALRARKDVRSCIGCHPGAWTGHAASIPSAMVCRSCHGEKARTKSTEEKRMRQRYLARGADIPWIQLTTLVRNVHFSHKAHVRHAGYACAQCHEDPRGKEAPPATASVWRMEACMRCHEERGAANDCISCHK